MKSLVQYGHLWGSSSLWILQCHQKDARICQFLTTNFTSHEGFSGRVCWNQKVCAVIFLHFWGSLIIQMILPGKNFKKNSFLFEFSLLTPFWHLSLSKHQQISRKTFWGLIFNLIDLPTIVYFRVPFRKPWVFLAQTLLTDFVSTCSHRTCNQLQQIPSSCPI